MRIGIQEYLLIADVAVELEVPKNPHFIYVQETGRLYNWVQGSVKVANGSTVLEQTSAVAIGRWESITASTQKVSGSVTFPVVGNAGFAVGTASMAVGSLPIGTAISASISNGSTCYTGGVAIPADVVIVDCLVTAPDKVSFYLMNGTGGTVDSFTATFELSYL